MRTSRSEMRFCSVSAARCFFLRSASTRFRSSRSVCGLCGFGLWALGSGPPLGVGSWALGVFPLGVGSWELEVLPFGVGSWALGVVPWALLHRNSAYVP